MSIKSSQTCHSVRIPIWAKLSPAIADIDETAAKLLANGAHGIATINTLKGFAGLNVEELTPKLNIHGVSVAGGFSGRMVKPIALKKVIDIATSCNNCPKGEIKFNVDTLPYISG